MMRGPQRLCSIVPPLPLSGFHLANIKEYCAIRNSACDTGVEDDIMAYDQYQVESQTRILFPSGRAASSTFGSLLPRSSPVLTLCTSPIALSPLSHADKSQLF